MRDETCARCVVDVASESMMERLANKPVQDWAELGAMIQRAARRAMAVHLVEAAASQNGSWMPAAARFVESDER